MQEIITGTWEDDTFMPRHQEPWRKETACAGTDPDLFFVPPEIQGKKRKEQEAAAKAICMGCRVVEQCLERSMSHGIEPGIWGGLTQKERRLLARKYIQEKRELAS